MIGSSEKYTIIRDEDGVLLQTFTNNERSLLSIILLSDKYYMNVELFMKIYS